MQIKKYPNAMLENYSLIFLQLGFVFSLFVVYEFMKMKSYPSEFKELIGTVVSKDDTNKTIEIKIVEPEIKTPAVAVVPDRIIKVEDAIEIKEFILESTESDQYQAVVISDIKKQLSAVVEEEVVVEDVPFMVIENVPVYPGCFGNNDELRACFSKQISKFVSEKFNSGLASDLGLASGSIQKIYVTFKVNKFGEVTDIQARAPHKQLQEEAIRVINLIPKMTPGKQRGKPVNVNYGLPIVFKVQ
ncbi:energy transducer TonB [Lutibacter sp.]|uniref:energy transducer TonB n=1 Tax=Lutibacter sp. TaxID=1925666 RepID=UPI0027327D9C|nr:energy transducer TonB [Lutibacter sp.]MDP3314262.1 energy transducer TonB [Lutibacter sp.]